MKKQPSLPTVLRVICLLLLSLAASPAYSDAYKFEIVIFERPGGNATEAWPDDAGQPDSGNVVGRLESLSAGNRSLGPIAYTLKQKGLIVHEHIAWYQTPRGRSSDAWYSVGSGRLTGRIKVTRGRFLHLDADLLLRDANTAQPFHAKLYRRMRSGELHYLDHPKIGIIFRADPLRSRSKPDAADASAGEPRPAQPAGTAGPS